MIEIYSNSDYSKAKLKKAIARFMCGEYSMDIDMMHNKLQQMLKLYRDEKKPRLKAHYKEIIDGLGRACRQAEDEGFMSVNWSLKDDRIVSDPPLILRSGPVTVDFYMYMLRKDEKIVYENYDDMWNGIALELAQRDISDMSIRNIDDALCDCSIVSPNDGNELKKVGLDGAYDRAVTELIDKSSYRTHNGVINYFGKKVKTPYYRKLLRSSIDKATMIILEKTLIKEYVDNVEFIGAYGRNLVYSVNLSNEDIEEILTKEYSIRVFNRVFEFKPKVSII